MKYSVIFFLFLYSIQRINENIYNAFNQKFNNIVTLAQPQTLISSPNSINPVIKNPTVQNLIRPNLNYQNNLIQPIQTRLAIPQCHFQVIKEAPVNLFQKQLNKGASQKMINYLSLQLQSIFKQEIQEILANLLSQPDDIILVYDEQGSYQPQMNFEEDENEIFTRSFPEMNIAIQPHVATTNLYNQNNFQIQQKIQMPLTNQLQSNNILNNLITQPKLPQQLNILNNVQKNPVSIIMQDRNKVPQFVQPQINQQTKPVSYDSQKNHRLEIFEDNSKIPTNSDGLPIKQNALMQSAPIIVNPSIPITQPYKNQILNPQTSDSLIGSNSSQQLELDKNDFDSYSQQQKALETQAQLNQFQYQESSQVSENKSISPLSELETYPSEIENDSSNEQSLKEQKKIIQEQPLQSKQFNSDNENTQEKSNISEDNNQNIESQQSVKSDLDNKSQRLRLQKQPSQNWLHNHLNKNILFKKRPFAKFTKSFRFFQQIKYQIEASRHQLLSFLIINYYHNRGNYLGIALLLKEYELEMKDIRSIKKMIMIICGISIEFSINDACQNCLQQTKIALQQFFDSFDLYKTELLESQNINQISKIPLQSVNDFMLKVMQDKTQGVLTKREFIEGTIEGLVEQFISSGTWLQELIEEMQNM